MNAKPPLKTTLAFFIPLLVIYMASYFQRAGIPGTIFNQLQADAGLSAVQVAAVSSSYIWVYSLSQLFIGLLVDKFCGVRVVLVGGLLLILGSLAFPCSTAPWAMYIGRMFTGLGAGTIFLSLVKEGDRCFARSRYPTVLGFIYASAYVGGILGSLPFAWACQHFYWRSVLLAVGFVTLLAYLLFAAGARKLQLPRPKHGLSLGPMLKKLCTNPLTWLVLLSGLMTFANYFVVQTVFGMKFLQDFAGMSVTGASAIVFMLTVTSVVGVLVCPQLCRLCNDRRKPLLIGFNCVSLAAMALMMGAILARSDASWPFAIGYILCAVSASGPSLMLLMIQETNSRDVVALAPGLANMFSYLAVTFLTIVVGICLDHFPSSASDAGVTIFSTKAYMTVFGIMASLAAVGLLAASRLPETFGRYINEK